jgi:hypothetical protein
VWAVLGAALVTIIVLVGTIVVLTGDDEDRATTEDSAPDAGTDDAGTDDTGTDDTGTDDTGTDDTGIDGTGSDDTDPDATEPDATDPPDTDATTAPATTSRPTLPPITLPPPPGTLFPPRPDEPEPDPDGPDVDDTLPPVTRNGVVGNTVTMETETTTIDVTLLRVVDPAPEVESAPPEEGHRIVAFEVRFVNVGDSDYEEFPTFGAAIVDEDGEASTELAFGSLAGPEMFSLLLRPGDTRTGWVTLQVPVDVAVAEFQWGPDSGFSGDRVSFDLSESEPPADASPPTPGDAGLLTAVPATTDELELSVQVLEVVDPAPVGSFAPDPGFHFVALNVEVTNAGPADYDAFVGGGAWVVSPTGEQYPTTFVDADLEPAIGFVELEPEEAATGYLTFQMRDGQVPIKALFTATLGFTQTWAEIDLPPSRPPAPPEPGG